MILVGDLILCMQCFVDLGFLLETHFFYLMEFVFFCVVLFCLLLAFIFISLSFLFCLL
jgi:hypothetical protein